MSIYLLTQDLGILVVAPKSTIRKTLLTSRDIWVIIMIVILSIFFCIVNGKYFKYSENYKPIRHSEPEKIMSEKAADKARIKNFLTFFPKKKKDFLTKSYPRKGCR